MNAAREIGKNFLKEMDLFIANNLDALTCADIYNIYSNFYMDLKQFKGNSSGFTGLSEYLIFRIFYNLFGGNFKPYQITRDLYEFRSINNKIRISQNIPIVVGSRRYYPDILIYNDDMPLMAVEIKIYLTSGIKDLENDIHKLTEINKEYPNTKGLFISYNPISNNGKIYKKLQDENNSKDWFNYLILYENDNLIKKCLETMIVG